MYRYSILAATLTLVAFLLTPVSAAEAANAATRGQDSSSWCGTWDWGIEASLARHELNLRRQVSRFTVRSASTASASDTRGLRVSQKGRVALIEDSGEFVIDRNPFDYDNKGVKYLRKGKNGYLVKTKGGSVNSILGEKLNLSDDDSVLVSLPDFNIRFFGKSYSSFFVNSDGNITFKKADTASTSRDLQRMLIGPPRVSPLFADLDPASAAGDGGVYVRFSEGKVTVTWWKVPNFDKSNVNTFEVSFNPKGNIEFQFDKVDSAEAIVGIAPGGGSGLELVDLTSDLPLKRKGIAVVERFSRSVGVDEVGVAQTFIARFGDDFDQLVLFTDFKYLLGDSPFTIAYHMNVNNQVRGIGSPVFNASRFFGSNGRLEGFNNMGHLSKYPKDLSKDVFINDMYSAIDVLAHEIGHQWLVGATFVDDSGQVSEDLLGRSSVHWSYFFNSELSFLEGNKIQDNGGGSFSTLGGQATYNDLDLYMMGMLPANKVSGFWYVDPAATQDTDTLAPEAGGTFQGTRVDLGIQQVRDALGPRRPSAADSPKQFHIGFILLTKNGKKAPAASVNQVEQFAKEIERLFQRETRQLGRIDTDL